MLRIDIDGYVGAAQQVGNKLISLADVDTLVGSNIIDYMSRADAKKVTWGVQNAIATGLETPVPVTIATINGSARRMLWLEKLDSLYALARNFTT